jgi:hypothetical protein
MRKTIFFAGTFILVLLILSGCGKLDRKGPEPVNSPPLVYFSNIPPESTYFSVNPRIYWFGTDQDGFVAAYQYAVMVTDSVLGFGGLDQVRSFLHDIPSDSTSWVDQTTLRNILGFHVRAAYGGHQQNVRMYADMDPTIYTPQYVFLRAVDNDGAVSNEVIYRLYYRNNHRPQAFVDTTAGFIGEPHYCLEETTATWPGISISWSGLDTADYPDTRNQPAFMFKWDLVGPFVAEPTPQTVDTTKVFYFSMDSIQVAGEWKESRWVSASSHVFTGLENYPDSGFGWYQLRLWAQDDAFVSNDLAATVNFRIIKPLFRYADRHRKTMLVVDATAYGGRAGGIPDSSELRSLLVRSFYQGAMDYMIQRGVLDEGSLWYDPNQPPTSTSKSAPGKDLISHYDLVLVVNVGSLTDISGGNLDDFAEYMDIGGRLWMVGINNYNIDSGRELLGLTDFWVEYFGLEQAVAADYSGLDSMTLDFIEAKPFGLWSDLPTLQADTALCHRLRGYADTAAVTRFGERGIPRVGTQGMSNLEDADDRIPYQRRMFSFVSYYGTLSLLDDKPCGINFIGPTFRTAEFTFPLNLMENQAPDYPGYQVVEKTVEWFWEDLP